MMEMFDDLNLVYSEALTEVIATVTGIHLNTESRENDSGFDDVTGVMILKGKKSGLLSVSAKTADVIVLCSNIIGVPEKDVTDDDIDDTMCELVNMTAGSAKQRLSDSEYFFNLTQPFVIKGKDVTIVTKSITNVVACTLGNGDISVKIKAIY